MKKLIVLLVLGVLVISCNKEASYKVIAESNMAIENPKVTVGLDGPSKYFYCDDIEGCGTNKVSIKVLAENNETVTITNLPGQFTVKIFRKGKEVEPYYFNTGAKYRHK